MNEITTAGSACTSFAPCWSPLSSGTATEVGTHPCPCLPYYFRSPKFLPRPISLSQGPPWLLELLEHQFPPPSPSLWHEGTPPTPGGGSV